MASTKKTQPAVAAKGLPLWVKVLGVFLIFFVIHSVVQFSTPFFADSNDSFYHAKMGLMMSTDGILQQFPWLYHTVLNENFVNHHLLFHLMLTPFILLGNGLHAVGAIGLEGLFWGPKLFIVLVLGLLATVFYLFLDHGKIPFKWLWMTAFLAVPYDFYFRLHMIRVQGLSLLTMLLGLYLLWKKQYVWLGIVCLLYVWLYGGFFFLPIFVAIYVAISFLRTKKFLWKPLAFAFGGMALGFVINPYFPKNIIFLYNQIFETGLGYEINVGGEWKPYDTWYIFQMGVVTFGLQIFSLIWTYLKQSKISVKAVTLLTVSFFYLILMWKSKRFVEYWPVFALLSSAFLLKDYLKSVVVDTFRVISFASLFLAGYIGIFALGRDKVLLLPYVDQYFMTQNETMLWVLVFVLLSLFIAGCFSIHMQKIEHTFVWERFAQEVVIGFLVMFLPLYSVMNMNLVVRDIAPSTAYFLDAKDIMACLVDKGGAQKGDIVMTDDWDIFPLFFFYNNLTNYIVGLDPIFMQKLSPALYEDFANITMGKDGANLYERLRDVYKAKYVVIDAQHPGFRANVEATPGIAKVCSNGNFSLYKLVQ